MLSELLNLGTLSLLSYVTCQHVQTVLYSKVRPLLTIETFPADDKKS